MVDLLCKVCAKSFVIDEIKPKVLDKNHIISNFIDNEKTFECFAKRDYHYSLHYTDDNIFFMESADFYKGSNPLGKITITNYIEKNQCYILYYRDQSNNLDFNKLKTIVLHNLINYDCFEKLLDKILTYATLA